MLKQAAAAAVSEWLAETQIACYQRSNGQFFDFHGVPWQHAKAVFTALANAIPEE